MQSYRVSVPDNVPIDVRDLAAAPCAISGVRASVQISTGRGDIEASGFCGYSFAA